MRIVGHSVLFDLLIMMRIHTFLLGIAIAAWVASPSNSSADTITDQYGTEILTDVLPPVTRSRVQQTQSVLEAGGGQGPIAVDKRGRFDLGVDGRGSAPEEEEYLVNQMLGVVLLPSPGDVRPDGWPGVEGIWHDFEDFPKEVGFALQRYIGAPVSLSSLDRMVKDVIVAYREGDRPVVDVLLPEQDITSGVIQLVVIESELARIRVEGVDVDTEGYIRSQMRVRNGEVIRSSEVLRDLSWVNRSPYRKVDMVYAPGFEFGTTDIILKTYETRANWFYTGYEDSGTSFLGEDRIIFGFNFGDVFGPDQTLSYQYTGDLDFEHVKAHSLVYTKSLPWRHNVTILASYVSVRSGTIPVPGVPGGIVSEGENMQLSSRYTIPLDGKANRRREMDFGFDWKSNGNALEFFSPAAGAAAINLFGSRAEIFQFSLGYNETIQHSRGVTQFNIRGVWSPGDFNSHNTERVFNLNRFASSPDYFYGLASVEHQRRLYDQWSMRFKMQGQVASENLQPSEQLGAGGYDTVRGYEQRELIGDQGFWGTFELYTPELSLARIFDWENETDSLRFLGFFDAASLEQVVPLPGSLVNQQQIGSVGVGMRWNYSDWFKFRADYGYPVFTDNIALDESGRFHIGATATF